MENIGDMLKTVFSDPTDADKNLKGPFEGPKVGRPRAVSMEKSIGNPAAVAEIQKLFAPIKPIDVGQKSGAGTAPNLNTAGPWGTPKE